MTCRPAAYCAAILAALLFGWLMALFVRAYSIPAAWPVLEMLPR